MNSISRELQTIPVENNSDTVTCDFLIWLEAHIVMMMYVVFQKASAERNSAFRN